MLSRFFTRFRTPASQPAPTPQASSEALSDLKNLVADRAAAARTLADARSRDAWRELRDARTAQLRDEIARRAANTIH
ncbi:hypothetical protein [Sphingomonas oryzagri]|uniref:Uncharacterized protein n=1 Tax=Sphingomonas oryzagri TaxID=3042314 RepID=A0ABT6N7V6_9SPHN|nr:hypothetical protein [Sphingomonas oryzagri]MDH7641178.1 hypothetical protein [Sphingomonas oryzagri]